MVCLGNICRSPIADGLLQHKVAIKGLDVFVDSSGTAGYHIGEKPDKRMRETAKSFGISIDNLRARQFSVGDFDDFDIIYAMDSDNYDNIIELARNSEDQKKVHLILNESYPSQDMNVPDPYYGGDQGFIEVYNLLDEATDAILKKLN